MKTAHSCSECHLQMWRFADMIGKRRPKWTAMAENELVHEDLAHRRPKIEEAIPNGRLLTILNKNFHKRDDSYVVRVELPAEAPGVATVKVCLLFRFAPTRLVIEHVFRMAD